MENAKRIGYIWAWAVALGIGLAVANTPVASAAPGDSGKGSSSGQSSQSSDASSTNSDAPKPRRHPPKQADDTTVTPKKSGSDLRKGDATSSLVKTTPKPAALRTIAVAQPSHKPAAPAPAPAELTMLGLARRQPTVTTSATDPDFITSTHGFFGLFSVTSAADPDDNHYVAFGLRTPFFTNVLTSGTDPEDNLGFGAASIGIAGHTVLTFMSPFLNFSIAIPVEDPFAELFTALVRAGF
jgi:hypothetical protein